MERCIYVYALSTLEGLLQASDASRPSGAPAAASGTRYMEVKLMSTLLESLRARTQAEPASAAAWEALGLAHVDRGENEQALEPLRHACRLNPDRASYPLRLAEALLELGRRAEIPDALARAGASKSIDTECSAWLGRLYADELGELETAAACYARAARLSPDHASGYAGLCRLALKGGADADAVFARIREQVRPWGLEPVLHRGLAKALEAEGRYAEARGHWAAALPDVEAMLGLTHNHLATRDTAAADRYSREALSVAPADYEANRCRLSFLLGANRLAEAKALTRRQVQSAPAPRNGEPPPWDGSPVEGRTVLLRFTTLSGFGDVIHGMLAAELFHAQGARVVVECPRRSLWPLVADAASASAVVQPYDPRPECDFACGASHALGLLDWTWDSLRAHVPYLRPSPRAASARYRVEAAGAVHVGFHWISRSQVSHNPYRHRSMPGEALRPLAELPGVAAYSLQVGRREGEPLPFRATDLAPRLADFDDTAGAVGAMDLVVAVDSSVTHLAGALGQPCVAMVPYFADSRWCLYDVREDRAPVPWYPSATLVRQSRPGDWGEVVARVAVELRDAVERIRWTRRNGASAGAARP